MGDRLNRRELNDRFSRRARRPQINVEARDPVVVLSGIEVRAKARVLEGFHREWRA